MGTLQNHQAVNTFIEAVDNDIENLLTKKTTLPKSNLRKCNQFWKRILTSKQFAESSTDLCTTIANMIEKLHIDKDLANTLEAFLSCRLIPLDKNQGCD